MINIIKEITPKDLLKVFNRFIQEKDERVLILYIDLYLEYFIIRLYNEALMQNKIILKSCIFKGCMFRKIFNCDKKVGSIKTKIEILVENNIIDPMFKEIILLILKLRQELVHNLEPNKELLEKWINNHKLPDSDIKGLIKKFFETANPWDKIQLYAFPTVFSLYKELKLIKNEKLAQDLEFHINPDATGLMIVLKDVIS